MLGLHSDIAGASARRFFGAERGDEVQRKFGIGATRIDTIASGVEPVLKSDGSRLWVGWTSTPVYDDAGHLEYILVMLEDVTAKHAAEETTLTNIAELQRLNALKSDFVGVVSHEFRTALTGIQGFSELIKDGQLEADEMREFAADINQDALRLNRMITEMLELERIEAGKITLDLAPVDLNQLIEDCVDRARSTSARHEVTTRLEPDLPVIQGDSDKLIQVVSNLLNNAIKYSPAGGPVEVSSWHTSNQVVVSIADHGLGIPPEFIDRVFERFERYEASPTSRIIGTGLGLPIARQIVEIHGGRMWVESQVGHGSIFHFALPLGTA
jgi:signal transduction histidine kinase